MTTYYFDWDNGDDTNNGTSSATPKKSYDAYTALGTAGDSFLFKRGTTQIISTAFKSVRSGSAAAGRTYYGVYGTATVPYATFKNPSGAGNIVLNFGGKNNLLVENLRFDATNCNMAVYVGAQSANAAYDITFRNCEFFNSNANGCVISRETSASVFPYNNVVEDCSAYNNAGHGFFVVSGERNVIRRCKAYRNALTSTPSGAHGISVYSSTTAVTSGWTSGGGTIYYRAVTGINANATDVYYVTGAPSPYNRMIKNDAAGVSPGVGEFSVSGGNLYININANPSGTSLNLVCFPSRYNIVEYNESFNNKYVPSTTYHEGHGIALDDCSEYSIVRGNYCHDNQGAGLSVNRGNYNLVYGNVFIRNWLAAIAVNPSIGTKVINNTCVNNNVGTGSYTSEILFNFGCVDSVISNNIIASTKGNTYGVDVDPSSTGFTGATNYIYGYTTATRTGTYTDTVTTDIRSYLDSEGNLKSVSLSNAGTYIQGVSLKNDRTRPGYTPVGATQVGRV